MTFSRRPLVFVFVLSILLVSSFICTLTAQAPTASSTRFPSTRITAAANITLRAMPASDASSIAQLPLGTELADAGPAGLDKTWIRVKLADNREGWLQSNLTRALDPVWRWPVFDRIITERLGRKGDGFTASVELVNFIERVSPEYTDADGRGRIELSRLRALSTALSAVPMNGQRREPYASWLTSRKADATYDEPGGRWMLADTQIWDAHVRQIKTTSADDIAWFAVTNGLAGECEGHIPCYLAVRNRLHGEYLRRHPMGRHASEAVAVIKNTVDVVATPPKGSAAYQFDRKQDCRDLVGAIDALTAAVQATRVENRDAALGSLATLKKTCQ